MSIPNLHDTSLINAQLRAVSLKMGAPHPSFPAQSIVAALAKHGGMHTLLDPDLMTARVSAFITGDPATSAIVSKLQAMAASFFYKLVEAPGYKVHSELMAYISEPGKDNGVTYDEGADASPDVPAAFTFVGQFVDHDLTFNGMNLTADEQGVGVQDDASPVIDLDNVYGPRQKVLDMDPKFYAKVFDAKGKFILNPVPDAGPVVGYDVPRNTDVHMDDPKFGMAFIFDPRNDENQLILQIHILLQRLHNALIDAERNSEGFVEPKNIWDLIERVRKEVVANWQSFLLNEYMPAVLDADTLKHVLKQIHIKATDPKKPQLEFGDLKNKPLRDLVTGKNVIRMPHEFAIGFRFGHSQLRPMYLLNKFKKDASVVLLFKDARVSPEVKVDVQGGGTIKVNGTEDLRGNRPLSPDHVIDWDVFYPEKLDPINRSLLIDHKVTARVFNLPESAIPDDIKYIGNLPHRNLLRGSQIGVVSGEELAKFYKITPLTPQEILGDDNRMEVRALFELDSPSDEKHPKKEKAFKTPLWFYILKEAETQTADHDGKNGGNKLGKLGSRLVAEVLAVAIYCGNLFPFDDAWKSRITGSNTVRLRQIIEYVKAAEIPQKTGAGT